MGFLDNSGDIILDAVLTDTGRKRLARGDGSFKIVKFALGDDEIDYSLYRNSNSSEGVHPSGSAYYDLNILQTPILEAFTNNASVLKSKLISYAQNDLLYLPVIKLNNILFKTANSQTLWTTPSLTIPDGGYIVTADKTTSDEFVSNENQDWSIGLIKGDSLSTQNAFTSKPLVFDQGLDTNDLNVGYLVDNDARKETAYILELDNRLFDIYPPQAPPGGNIGGSQARPSYIDDDNISSYYFGRTSHGLYFAAPRTNVSPSFPGFNIQDGNADPNAVIGSSQDNNNTGRYGSRFGFRLATTLNVQTSTNLFTTLGGTTTQDYENGSDADTFYYIDTVIRVTGYTTGYRVDVPIRILKKQ